MFGFTYTGSVASGNMWESFTTGDGQIRLVVHSHCAECVVALMSLASRGEGGGWADVGMRQRLIRGRADDTL